MKNEIFINKAILKHGDIYDYSKVEYIKSSLKVIITCKIHGDFEQKPNGHLSGDKCPRCSTSNCRSSSLDFIRKAELKHNGKYDYSVVNYINNKTKVDIICREHGLFTQIPNNHLRGQNCPKCNYRNVFNTKDFIKMSNIIFNNRYNYSKVNYSKNNIKVEIICEKHKSFLITPASHLRGRGCNKCGKENMSVLNTKSLDFILSSFIDKHGYLYDYSNIKYSGTKNKVDIVCKIHGTFSQTPEKHISGNGCPKCNISKGERRIMTYLDRLKIDYNYNYNFDDCRDKLTLPFDFYIPEYNLCIEFDGEQHYRPIKWFGGDKNFKSQKKRDYIKDMYCLDNKISLIRISYLEYDKIFEILDSIFNI
jgi:Zn finger protein HypA/HybF involved in hydrogenase expression